MDLYINMLRDYCEFKRDTSDKNLIIIDLIFLV